MTALCLASLPVGHLALDYCASCRGIWFDAHESTRLASASVLALFRIVCAHAETMPASPTGRWLCPRCDAALVATRDLSRGGRFAYERCPDGHGRFTPYTQFLVEKGFVRHLAPTEIGRLGAAVAQFRCHACGGPLDLRRDTACPHCRSALAVLDPQAMQKTLEAYDARVARSAGDLEGRLSLPRILSTSGTRHEARSLLELGIQAVVAVVDIAG